VSVVLLWALLAALDGGAPPRVVAPPSAEDAEVVNNLELLEHLDESTDLELLHELSADDR